ncbi:MAG: serine protease [Pirellulaceae bacterium]|nr:serine protease [Pirellulaceae bacterium]
MQRTARICLAAGVLAGCLAIFAASAARGDEAMLSVEQQAAALQRVTVTVRVTLADTGADGAEADQQQGARVSVCSGVSLGNGLIVSSFYASTADRIRLTLPGGGQATARMRVMDEYSGLVLLATDRQDLPGIPLAEALPAVGRELVLAAAWGAEQPVVSRGIVSGVDRTLGGVSLPPLIQCDVRAAETASGAGIVDASGRLLGIVVLADQPDRVRGWTYAVPAGHVQRLLRAYGQRTETEPTAGTALAGDSVVVLKRRRPVVGMVLGGDADQVSVRRVDAGSPADRAGIRVGDRVLAADGIRIRSVYEAVRPVLFKQPGDVMQYLIEQADAVRLVEVQLGGGVELPSATLEQIGQYVRPKIDIEGLADGHFRASSSRGEVREVFAGEPDLEEMEADPPVATNAERLQMLQRALEAYRSVIAYQQKELGRRDEERKQMEQQIRLLQEQLQQLQPAR